MERYCSRCGDCCKQFVIRQQLPDDGTGIPFFYNLHENVYAWVQEEEGKRMLNVQIKEKCSMLVEHNDGTTSCKIYPARPPVCREFPKNPNAGRDKTHSRCTMLLPVEEEETLEETRIGGG